jgi:hypothetical protein
MEIYFCDICNESVPDSDLQAGLAYRRKDRVICLSCDTAMGGHTDEGGEVPLAASVPGFAGGPFSVEAPPLASGTMPISPSTPLAPPAVANPVAPGGAGAGGVFVGMLALVFAALGLWALLDRVEALGAEQRDGRRALEADQREARRVHDTFVAGMGERILRAQQEVHDKEITLRVPLEGDIQSLTANLALSVEREAVAAGDVRALRGKLESQQAAGGKRLQGFQDTLIEVEKNLSFYKNRVIELEENLRVLSAGGLAVGPGATTPSGATKTWTTYLPDLQHANGGLRLEAVYALGEVGDSDVVPYLTPMLQDEDLFVRMATARMLDELGVKSAVPALIEALDDVQGAVREAAVVALRRITDENQGFNPVGSDVDRAKKLKAWRDWWKRKGDDFLTGR